MPAAPLSRAAAPPAPPVPATGVSVARAAAAVGRLVLGLLFVVARLPLAHARAVGAFRRALREAGLPPEAAARLARQYGEAGSPRAWLDLARGAMRR